MAPQNRPVQRITMFKIPNPDDRDLLVQSYARLQETALKDGRPYILSLAVGPALDEARSKGYTFVAQTRFASLEDMKYYDNGDEAHAQLKATMKGKATEPPLVMFFENALDNSDEFVRLQA